LYELTVTTGFAAAHALHNFQGKCENLHGHNWKVEVTVRGAKLDQAGMVIDFARLKGLTNAVLDELDHTNLNDLPAFKEVSPSSENIARLIFDSLAGRLEEPGVDLVRVTAWESETSRASYLGPDV